MNAELTTMMTQAPSQNLLAPFVDRAASLALRRTMMPGVRDKGLSRRRSSVDISRALIICISEHAASSARRSSIPVAIVSPTGRGKRLSWSQIKLDLSWMAAAFVALAVTLVLAIPLELLRQHG
jgi:hypothetical protein